jgi:hypothetical protein
MAQNPENETPQQWLERQFEFEFCPECGGDAEHHDVISSFPFPGTNFAACKYPPCEETFEHHPVIQEFHSKQGAA